MESPRKQLDRQHAWQGDWKEKRSRVQMQKAKPEELQEYTEGQEEEEGEGRKGFPNLLLINQLCGGLRVR